MRDNEHINHITTEYEKLSIKERQYLHAMFQDGDELTDNFNKLEKIIFKKRPPTPEEFLDPESGWLSQSIAESVYPHVRESFIEILNPKKNYNQLVLYGASRTGKSFLSRLLILYTIVFIHHLREPNLYYNLSPVTNLAVYLIAFKLDKSRQLLMKPFFQLIEQSEKFVKVNFQDQVKAKQQEVGIDKIVYSRAADVGEITLSSGLQIVLGNDDPLSIIGSDLIAVYISEIMFFVQNGATEEEIFQLYSDSLDRIKATVGNSYLAWCFLDSSANNADSVLENYILRELSKYKNVFFKQSARWEDRPYLFPIWQKTGETFTVITGDGSHPAQIVTKKSQLKDVPKHLIIEVPIDVKPEFELNLVKSIKDIAGRPTSNEFKFIQDIRLINNLFNNIILKNIKTGIIADSKEDPENLIWDQVWQLFFSKYDGENYIIKRAPREVRWIGVDLSYSAAGDVCGIAAGHKEFSTITHKELFVTDFAFVVLSGENGINLDAIKYFVTDLVNLGNIGIQMVTTDTFQSEFMVQYLERINIPVEKMSVDKSIDPYLVFYSYLINETIKAGDNVFLRNNLDSLYREKRGKKDVIEHSKNKPVKDIRSPYAGTNQKDCSDALCQCSFSCSNSDVFSSTAYEEENDRLSEKPSIELIEEQIDKSFKLLHRYLK